MLEGAQSARLASGRHGSAEGKQPPSRKDFNMRLPGLEYLGEAAEVGEDACAFECSQQGMIRPRGGPEERQRGKVGELPRGQLTARGQSRA